MRVLYFCFSITIAAFSPNFAVSQHLSVRVVDGDTLTVAGERIRLFGIDAPEKSQPCINGDGAQWRCGRWAQNRLQEIVATGPLRCNALSKDRYGRTVARCFANGKDVAAEMVASGAAFAYREYSLEYVGAEKEAFLNRRGIWSGKAEKPSSYRAQGSAVEDPTCRIKGNISASGKIYHMPGQAFYNKTRIHTGKGERCFSTEAEARAAGWRAAKR